MLKFILTFLIILLQTATMLAQQGEFVQSDKLATGWEFASIFLENDWGGWVLNLPVTVDRKDFLFENFESSSKEEAKKFLLRFTYKYKNQLYEFILAVRGTIPSRIVKNKIELDSVLNDQEKKLNDIIKTAERRGEAGLNESLASVKKGLYEAASETVSQAGYNSYMEDTYIIIYLFRGYHLPIRNEDSESEVKKNIKYIIQNVEFHDHGI